MTVQALRAVTKAQNGVGAFILQCKRLDFHYCDWAGSSKGMNAFINTHLARFASANPTVELTVSPRPGKHPVIRGTYINGREKAVCVRNMTPHEILEKANYLRGASGEKLKRSGRAGRTVVRSQTESVRGVWSPFHGQQFKV
ncbi:39S ribosomal protein L51, mitochondrial [Vermiconidia calcicola]|uniref:39S ribosomal protein L51, mitochondrial n=1 Tax=Vermiconidia calcicola TaxID=1690605 RepID=A0ACC3MRV6_9PEZI|nr:39S ribosomal protein L51, mitochondrial [Vermiconidia calcicola]